MTADATERLNYFQNQNLGAADFQDEQAYHRDMRRRHNLGPHDWGVVTGLEIVEKAREGDDPYVDIFIMPGVAVDGYGREIIVLEPAPLPAALFSADTGQRLVEVHIAYEERALRRPQGGFAPCKNDEAFSRVRESFRLFGGARARLHDELVVAGRPAMPAAAAAAADPVLPDDKLVAFQEFADDDGELKWFVRLGEVNWDGAAGKFTPAGGPERLRARRAWAGLRGVSVKSESNALALAPRFPFAKVDDQDFADVQGRMSVQGRISARMNVDLWGHRLRFLREDGSEKAQTFGGKAPAPLWMQRMSAGADDADLRIHIGDAETRTTRLTIGPGPSATQFATEKVVLGVRADNCVEIPTGALSFGAAGRQSIDLFKPNDDKAAPCGLGTQADSTFMRTGDAFWWYGGGGYIDAAGEAGQGGLAMMTLDKEGRLYFPGASRQVVNMRFENKPDMGFGAQQDTLYARAVSGFNWYLGGSHAPAAGAAGGGLRVMELDGNGRLTLSGGLTTGGSIRIDGPGGENTDPLIIERVNRASDNSDLQVIIGNDAGGGDRLRVGPRAAGASDMTEVLAVYNDGRVYVKDKLFVRNNELPVIDVFGGERVLNVYNASGADSFQLTSRLSATTGVPLVVVSLSDIGNEQVANSAHWRVHAGPSVRINDRTWEIQVNWRVDDSDGYIVAYNYLVIFFG